MTTHLMKIRPHFIESIRSGKKKHEYRLADEKRQTVKAGDIFVLISNQDPSDYVRVHVEGVNRYANWDDALKDRWQSDFEGVYSSYDQLLKECFRFYPAEQVKKYGILVFDIKPEVTAFKKKSYLLDTNIIIHRESHDETLPIAAKLYRWIDKENGDKCFHPILLKEIQKYSDREIAASIKAKLEAYEQIVPTEERDSFFLQTIGDAKDENSKNDDLLLLQVYSGRVDFLITSDRGILRKAERLFIKEKVFAPEEFVQEMERLHPDLVDYEVLSIIKEKIGNLRMDDPFFDSLREDYGQTDFNAWLNRKSQETAYVFKDKTGALKGFLYLKQEDVDEPFEGFDHPMKRQKWLKVGTFKNDVVGLRVGERFFKIIFDNALKFDVDGIYVTLFEDKRPGVKQLLQLLEEWGFEPYCHKDNGELVLVKDMRLYRPSKSPKFNYPLSESNSRGVFLPIEAKWHEKLFPDSRLKHDIFGSIYDDLACSYAIEKVYVCKWTPKTAKPGELVFIYRMGEYFPKKYHSVVTGTCLFESVENYTDQESFLQAVKNKSVFSENELKSRYGKGYHSVVKVLYLKPLPTKVILNDLYRLKICQEPNGPRIGDQITPAQARQIIKEGDRT